MILIVEVNGRIWIGILDMQMRFIQIRFFYSAQ